jgi:hypothetical protein
LGLFGDVNLIHTCENGRFQQLHELVDLYKCVHGHLEVGTVTVSGGEVVWCGDIQNLEQMVGLLVGLSKEAE